MLPIDSVLDFETMSEIVKSGELYMIYHGKQLCEQFAAGWVTVNDGNIELVIAQLTIYTVGQRLWCQNIPSAGLLEVQFF